MTRSEAWRLRLTAAAVAVALPVGASALEHDLGQAVAVLGGLDKITARISTFVAPIDQTVSFGTLQITVRYCRTRPPEEPPETSAFLEITEQRDGADPVQLYSGWMMASSPAWLALEHPVYDVWVIACNTVDPPDPASSE